MNSNSTKSSNQTVITILKWIFSILIGLSALGALASKSFLSCLILLLVTALLLPPLTEFWRNKLPFLKNRIAKIASVIVLFIIGMAVSNDIGKTTSTTKEEKKTEETVSKSEEEIEETAEVETIPTIKYEILHETIKRYDKAPSYFVLIDEVNLSNDKFKEDIKNLINKIVTEKGAKISIDILDNKNALELFYKSHYGANTLGRILNKSELAQLEKHSVASFSGELETDMYPNTLYFFPSASKSTAKVGKFVEIIEYNPVIKDDRIVKKQRADLNNQKAQSDKKKKDFEKNCFSSWDGSHRELVKLVKANMNDKKSFEHEETTYTTLDDYAVVIMKFRGKNALGNMVLNSVKAKISYNCEVLEIIE
ncbi:hypothetical protein [Bergeyella sp. RCAD1439]|uniref:hypothetical protein n=1 Tax=Bergeyella anatis TaxID=3113737 RepID=UPI002E18074A|nr:hypothetical protein [Bergeyella sp. RCAD1439]